MKLANPLYYPIAVLAGGLILVLGVRLANLPGLLLLPVAAGVTTVGAAILRGREPAALGFNNPALEREFLALQKQALLLVQRTQTLRQESAKWLSSSDQIDLLVTVQEACDRIAELPLQLNQLARRLQGSDSLLSVSDLQNQLAEVQTRLKGSSGLAQQQLSQLSESLQRNIQLALAGQDGRQAQLLSLSTLVQDAAGVLQQLQNQLHNPNLQDSDQVSELQNLGLSLKSAQESLNLLVSK